VNWNTCPEIQGATTSANSNTAGIRDLAMRTHKLFKKINSRIAGTSLLLISLVRLSDKVRSRFRFCHVGRSEYGRELQMKNRSIPVMVGVSALVLALIAFGSEAFQSNQQPAPPAATPAPGGGRGQPTAQQLAIQQAGKEDHRQMMDQLHIASLRPGVNARVAGSTNYDEAKANP
jgi:hypothetical protein